MSKKLDEIQQTTHTMYDEYERSTVVVKLAIGETMTVMVDGKLMKEYTAKYSNCHFNIELQDKGEMKEDSRLIEEQRS